MPKRIDWTDEDKAHLRKHYDPEQPDFVGIAQALGRTRNSVYLKAVRLGLHRPLRKRNGAEFAFPICIPQPTLGDCESVTRGLERGEIPYIIAAEKGGYTVYRQGIMRGFSQPDKSQWCVVYKHPEYGTGMLIENLV